MEQNDFPERIHVGPDSLEARAILKLQAGRAVGMGEIRASVKMENLRDRALFEAGHLPENKVRMREFETVVDTGAVMSLIPQDLAEDLGLKVFERLIVTLADDRKVEMNRVGPVTLWVVGRSMNTDCLVGPVGCEPLLGQLAMEAMDLVCDPGKRTLTVRPESPLRPTLKMKRSAVHALS